MPAAFAGTCYPDAVVAAAWQCATSYPQSGSDATSSWVVSCAGSTGSELQLVRAADSAASSAYTVAVSYPECNPDAIGSSVPTAAQMGQAWTWGFCSVVFLYMVAWGCGRVLDAIWAPRR